MTFKEAAEQIGCSARTVSKWAHEFGIPTPITEDDLDYIAYFGVYGPNGGMPKFTRQADGHFTVQR